MPHHRTTYPERPLGAGLSTQVATPLPTRRMRNTSPSQEPAQQQAPAFQAPSPRYPTCHCCMRELPPPCFPARPKMWPVGRALAFGDQTCPRQQSQPSSSTSSTPRSSASGYADRDNIQVRPFSTSLLGEHIVSAMHDDSAACINDYCSLCADNCALPAAGAWGGSRCEAGSRCMPCAAAACAHALHEDVLRDQEATPLVLLQGACACSPQPR